MTLPRKIALAPSLAILVCLGGAANAAAPPILPFESVRPGMKVWEVSVRTGQGMEKLVQFAEACRTRQASATTAPLTAPPAATAAPA